MNEFGNPFTARLGGMALGSGLEIHDNVFERLSRSKQDEIYVGIASPCLDLPARQNLPTHRYALTMAEPTASCNRQHIQNGCPVAALGLGAVESNIRLGQYALDREPCAPLWTSHAAHANRN